MIQMDGIYILSGIATENICTSQASQKFLLKPDINGDFFFQCRLKTMNNNLLTT